MKRFWSMVIAVLATGWIASASAQVMLPEQSVGAAPTISDPATPEAAREMVARLSDSEVRALLLHRLDAVAAQNAVAATQSNSVVLFLELAAGGVVESVTLAFERLPDLWSNQVRSFQTFKDTLGWEGIGGLFGAIAIALFVGFLAELLFNRLTRHWHSAAEKTGARET